MYRLNDKEINLLLDNLVIIEDSREQQSSHILSYFDDKRRNIRHTKEKLNSADYSCYIESNEQTKDIIGTKNLYFNDRFVIERKNSIDELSQSIKDRQRFEFEFMRLKNNNTKVILLVEDEKGLENLLRHNYRSQYDPKAFYASLKTFEARYNFDTIFLDKKMSGNFIYYTLRYHVREWLKTY